jgi:hypothetical protein
MSAKRFDRDGGMARQWRRHGRVVVAHEHVLAS